MKTNFLCLSLFLLALGLMSCDNDTKKDPVDSATENYIMVDGIVPFKDVQSHIYYDFDAIEDGVNYGYGHTLMIYGGATQEEMMQITTSFDKDIVGVSFLLYSNEKNALPAGTYRICYDGKGEIGRAHV